MVGSDQLLCMVTQIQKEFQVLRTGLQLDIRTLGGFGFLAIENVKAQNNEKNL